MIGKVLGSQLAAIRTRSCDLVGYSRPTILLLGFELQLGDAHFRVCVHSRSRYVLSLKTRKTSSQRVHCEGFAKVWRT